MDKTELIKLYEVKKLSAAQIAKVKGISEHKVRYWLAKHTINTRSISEAVYQRHNPHGDPFVFKYPATVKEGILFGLGLGLFWGEGTKANNSSVRLGNTDPKLIIKFMVFLEKLYGLKRTDFKFSVQIFNDLSATNVLDYWCKELKIVKSQFYKPTISPSISIGTYKRRAQYGVITIYFHNKKMRELLGSHLAVLAQW